MKSTRVLASAGLSLGLVMALQSGCAQNTAVKQAPTATLEATAPAAEAPAAPLQATAPEKPAAQEPALVGVSGKVVETLQAGAYTYVNIEKDGKKSWAAIASSFPVKVGDEISLKPGGVMQNFKSKSLDRTFESIVFSDGPINQAAVSPHGTQPPATPHATQAAQPSAADAAQTVSGKVLETMESGGYTYIHLEQQDGKKEWFAIPAAQVTVGQQVQVAAGMPMQNFTSKGLNRSFDKIQFSSGLAPAANAPAAAAKGALPAGHPPAAAAAQQAPAQQAPAQQAQGHMAGSHNGMKAGKNDVVVSGKVVETLDAGGYTFILLEQDGKKEWAAVPTTKVEPGQELKLEPGTEMLNFTSKRLNRDFGGRMVFSSGVAPTK